MQENQKRRLLSTPLFVLLPFAFIVFLVLATKQTLPEVQCPIRNSLGVLCPGCGGTSAIQHLLNGEVKSAFLSNPLFTFATFILLALNVYALIVFVTFKKHTYIRFTLNRGLIVIGAIVTFTIIRNLV